MLFLKPLGPRLHQRAGFRSLRSPYRNDRAVHALFSTSQSDTDKWSTTNVRNTFVEYFKAKHNHVNQVSSPVVPLLDPTLLFANAGMNQFKPIFLGQVDPSSPLANLKRACNSQKCIRAGGKHNDLDDVGRDTYHHTFFEMLGSWSFGDYFKEEAIEWAFDLLTNVYKIDQSRLYATYFGGDDKLGLPADTEARDFWLKYLPADRVIACDAADNFWEMGDTGPCGPCSEIHYDRIGNRDASALVNADDPDVIEIWNIVFIEFNRDESGLKPLPNKHIDTGMGLERLASLLQGKPSNYDIDVFQPLFSTIAASSKKGPYQGMVGTDDVTLRDTAYRAIADHARALSFAIADGAVPSNEGRGYVLRRILRRGVRYGQQILEADRGFFAKLIPIVVETFSEAYPELKAKEKDIIEIIEDEERAFGTMLDRGIVHFEELKVKMKDSKRDTVSGSEAFFMYDTMGFPPDLTEQMAEEANLKFDMDGFKKEMETQKERSRLDRKQKRSGASSIVLELIAEQTDYLSKQGILPTDDSSKYSHEASTATSGKVVAIFDGCDGDTFGFQSSASSGDYVGVILDKSSFYAESGGQEADLGEVKIGSEGGNLSVTDTQVFGGFVLHIGTVSASISVGDDSVTYVDYNRRNMLNPNHSMTHVLNQALREIVSDDVDQRGSLVAADKLRFDFTNKKALKVEQLQATEDFVNSIIGAKQPVYDEIVPLSDAQSINGVRAVFGEFYPDPVRVISFGQDVQTMLKDPDSVSWTDLSVEFCGGTHVANTAEAEEFVIIEETAVAKGVRRITAVTRDAAKECREAGKTLESRIGTAEGEVGTRDNEGMGIITTALRKDLDASVISAPLKATLRSRLEKLQKKVVELNKAKAGEKLNRCLTVVRENVVGKVVHAERFVGIEGKGAVKIAETVKKTNPECCFFGVIETDDGKVMAFASIPDDKTGDVSANDWLKEVLGKFGGRGGGKPGFAQGQAPDCDVEELLSFALESMKSKV
ncbi:hypothetical protein TrCOL_g12779 [Triparma columacea]|uniref:Alanine--tRNA ligase n=1 Tax=Triparma columacea TaxID=722753 RepID=A0A9W7L8T8_9STRA|nr:hypothetical protein TrCOL_g12779 [Triparma columacea]